MTSHRHTRTCLFIVFAFWAAAAGVYGSLRLIYGVRPALVHVRWSPTVDETRRLALERLYSLTRGELSEGTTWRYALRDLSRANVRAIVLDGAVEDTHQLHRTKFRVGYRTPRGPYVGAEQSWAPFTLEVLTVLLVMGGLLAAAFAAAAALGLPRGDTVRLRVLVRSVRRAAAMPPRAAAWLCHWLANRVPSVSPEAVAVFRIVFGLAVVAIVQAKNVGADWITRGQITNAQPAIQAWVMERLVAVPSAADWIGSWVLVTGVLFVIGAASRTSYLLLTAGVFVWALVYTTRISAHPVSVLVLTMLCLVPSRWGDAWSVDAWLRRRRLLPHERGTATVREPQASSAYGYTVWVPGVVLGVAFVAAAFAKVREGPAWILNGTVKYHFLTDSPDALVDWGLRLGRHPGLAVLLSLAAVTVEALVIAGALSTRRPHRAVAGVAATGILAGFGLFQGLFWPSWWILLLAFLRWHQSGPGTRPEPAAHETARLSDRFNGLRRWQTAAVVLLVLQQILATAYKIESPPMLSAYDMYSTTYDSPEQYEEKADTRYWLLLGFGDGTSSECEVLRDEADAVALLESGSTHWGPAGAALERCVREHGRATAASLASVAIEARRVRIDWGQWRLAGIERALMGEPIRIAPVARQASP